MVIVRFKKGEDIKETKFLSVTTSGIESMKIGSGYVIVTRNKNLTLGTPLLKFMRGNRPCYHQEIFKERTLYSIEFNGNWIPTSKFNEVFELVDDAGQVVTVASSDIKTYRFKSGRENYNEVNDVSNMFYQCRTLVSVHLPPIWGDVTMTYRMFGSCTSLKNIVFPVEYNNGIDLNNLISAFTIGYNI